MLKPNYIRIETVSEDSQRSRLPSLEYVESPLRKNTQETHEFLTEETLQMKSTPNTLSSFMPLSSNTFYGKIKDSVAGLKNSVSSKFLKDGESMRTSNERIANDIEKQPDYDIKTEAYDPYEINCSEDIPTLVYCAHCKGEMTSQTKFVNSGRTFWSAVGIFLAGGVAGCFLFPYMTNQCKDRQVTCSHCNRTLLRL